VVAAPVFRVVATEALRVLDVPKDLPEAESAKTPVEKSEPAYDLADADTRPGAPNILEGDDEEEAAVQAGNTGAPGEEPAPQKVPNFRGMTMRAVLAEALAMGLTVLPDGSGIARVQYPAPGSPLHQGDRIRVQFKR
jgi:cell division protein FtsI (penicillin-binding protein 3)